MPRMPPGSGRGSRARAAPTEPAPRHRNSESLLGSGGPLQRNEGYQREKTKVSGRKKREKEKGG